jgi:predicted RecA/RadA family phage recombinase
MAQTPAKYVQHGDVVDYTPGAAVTAGDVVLLGTIPCVAPCDIDADVLGSLALDGVWDVPKSSDAFTAGDAVYWDADGSPVTGTALSGAADGSASGNNLMGVAVLDAAAEDSYVRVKLTAAKRTTTIGGSVTADDVVGSVATLTVTGAPPATTSSAGGAVTLAGGIGGSVSGAGGAVSLTGGAGTTNAVGGASSLVGGAGQGTGAGGAGAVTGGAGGATGAGGAVSVAGGAGGATSGTGGALTLAGGAGTAGNASGGAVTLKGGEPHGSGAQGTVTIEGARMAAGTTGVAITSATTLTLADSGGIFTVGQGSAYDIDLPSPTTGAGLRFLFQLVSPAANTVTVTVAGAAATFEGTIHTEGAIVVATGSTLTFVSGTALLGDNIEVISTATGKYFVRAFASASGGITAS